MLPRSMKGGHCGERVTLKSDGEVSIVALKNAISASRIGKTGLIESPVRESKANGAAEAAINVLFRANCER